jgi:hypothetical protein
MDKFAQVIGVIVLGFLAITGLAVVMAYPTKWVINYLLTPSAIQSVFGAPELTVWKALALNFICATLFKVSASNSK